MRQCLSLLRRAIGKEWLVSEAGLTWVPEAKGLWTDVGELRRLTTASQRAEQAGDVSRAATLCHKVEQLFRGEFLDGVSVKESSAWEAWHRNQAEALRGEHVALLSLLASLQERQGDFEAALATAHRWSAFDTADERAHRALMRLYARTGKRSEALRQYERCAQALKEELDSAPDHETEALRGEIAEGRSGQPTAPAVERSPLAARRGNLRVELTSFIGREKELARLGKLLRSDAARLVTLTGTGGTGKTRLAQEAARAVQESFPHGVFFVDLAPLADPGQVLPAIAASLRLVESKRDERTLPEVLTDFLRPQSILLLLDNFEHLLDAATSVSELLTACPGLKVLATSREPLSVRGELELPVPPLELPAQSEGLAGLRQSEAVRLFVERATAVQPDFALTEENARAVGAVCARLDGLPLALELAATRIRAYPPSTLLGLLEHRLQVLEGGARDLPARQRTLRSEMDWSYDLLGPGEQVLFRRLSIFPGGFTVDSASRVCVPDGADATAGLLSLQKRNLIKQIEAAGVPRFRMLETIREYASERRREVGESEATGERFAGCFFELAERTEPGLYGPGQRRLRELLELEYDNLIYALGWLDQRGRRIELQRLAGALGTFWLRQARYRDMQFWVEKAWSSSREEDPPVYRAKVAAYLYEVAGWIPSINRDTLAIAEEALRLYRLASDQKGIALFTLYVGVCRSWWNSGKVGPDPGVPLMDQAVAMAREIGDPWLLSYCLKVAYARGLRTEPAPEVRRAALAESIALARETGDPDRLCETLCGMGDLLVTLKDFAGAASWYEQALQIAEENDDRGEILSTLIHLVRLQIDGGDLARGRQVIREALRVAVELGDQFDLPYLLYELARVEQGEGRMRRAARLVAAFLLFGGAEANPYQGADWRTRFDGAAVDAEASFAQSMTLERVVAYALEDEEPSPPSGAPAA